MRLLGAKQLGPAATWPKRVESLVQPSPLRQIFQHGAVVTDAAHCTALGIKVLNKQGSSVDAAIASALCAGIVNPHVSGIGG